MAIARPGDPLHHYSVATPYVENGITVLGMKELLGCFVHLRVLAIRDRHHDATAYPAWVGEPLGDALVDARLIHRL